MGLTLVVARHAATDAEGLCVGQHDVSTFVSADVAAAKIGAQLLAPPDTVWSSPLSRCAGPAALLAATLGCAHRVDPRLLEIHYGIWQGRTWADIEREEPEAFARFMARWQVEAPPGGESLREIEQRVGSWYAELGAGLHLLVAHAGVVRALRVLGAGLDWPSAMRQPVAHLTLETIVLAPPAPPPAG